MTRILIYKCDVCGSEHELENKGNSGFVCPKTVRYVTLTVSTVENAGLLSKETSYIKRVWCLECLEKANIPIGHQEEITAPNIDDLIRQIVEEELDERD